MLLNERFIFFFRYLAKPKLDLVHEQICAEGNRMSWQLLEMQNERLKATLKRVKDSQCKRIKFTYLWRDIVDLVTHEKSAWFFPEAFPRQQRRGWKINKLFFFCHQIRSYSNSFIFFLFSGWKLDATEGPTRIRRRITRCRLNIDNKFFHPYYLERHSKFVSGKNLWRQDLFTSNQQ